MSNILDYIDWRGDISFDVSPFNEVDAIILCQIEYNNFESIVGSEITKKGATLSDVADRFFVMPDIESRRDIGSLINPDTIELLKAAGKSVRFGSLKVSGYKEVLDLSSDEQFSAITYSYTSKKNKWNAIIYRGTDDNLVGWKEDFNLSYMEIPAQRDALSYFNKAISVLDGKFYLAGHSKGGNLAIYSSVKTSSGNKKRISDIYNFDGPGFTIDFFESAEFKAIENREHTYVPQNSLVGMLMYHADGYITVESTESNGIKQHDPFSWQVRGCHFVERPDITEQSKFIGKTIREWVFDLPVEQKKLFVETLFGILDDADAKTNTDLQSNPLETMKKVLHAANKLDQNTKDVVVKTIHLFIKYGWNNIGTLKSKK